MKALLGSTALAAGLLISTFATAGTITDLGGPGAPAGWSELIGSPPCASMTVPCPASSVNGFVAEGRAGTAGLSGDFELDVGRNTAGAFSTAQFVWTNDQLEPFSLSFDGTTATFTVGNPMAPTSVSYSTFSAFNEFDGLLIRLRAGDRNGSDPGADRIRMTDLDLDGMALGDISFTGGTGSNTANWWGVSGAGDLAGGFNLTGNVALSWVDAMPTRSSLAFQIKGADAPNVPVPASAALLAVGLAGLGLVRRRTA